MVREFGDTLRNELDYEREAGNVRFFRRALQDQRGFALPQVIGEFSTSRVLTLTRLDGTKPADAATLPKRRRATIARRIGRFVLEPAFAQGVFHADPHGGNFLITSDGALAVIDFGMTGRLTPDARRRVADIFIAMDRSDAGRLADRIIEITAPTHPVDRAALTAEIDRMLERYVPATLEEMRFGEALGELLELIRRFGLRLPGNLALLFKALAITEGLLEHIDPGATLNDHLEPLATKLMYGQLNGEDWIERARESAVDAAELSIELPRRLDRVMGEVERGNIRVWARIEDLETMVGRFEHIIERANLTMLASACIVGLAIVMVFYKPQGVERWIGIAFWAGVTVAFFIALRTVFATLRRKG
jgi:ubiquinone biosynthesis protein